MPDIQQVNTFEDVIAAIDRNETDPERHVSIQIDSSLRDAIRASRKSGQPADVTVKIKVKPSNDRRTTFAVIVSAKLPRPPVSGVSLFDDEFGCVHHSDPAQLKLPNIAHIKPPKEN